MSFDGQTERGTCDKSNDIQGIYLLPPGVEGSHFGPDVRAMIHGVYASGMTQPAIFQFIRNPGIEASETQIHNILMNEAQGYAAHSEEILSAGLQEAPYILGRTILDPGTVTKVVMVKFRNVSGRTKSEEEKLFRDGLMTLKRICHRLGEDFWDVTVK